MTTVVLHAFPTMQVNALDDSWELSSEGSLEYDYNNDDAFTLTSVDDDDFWNALAAKAKGWPDRGRFNNFPALSALIKNHCPPPMTAPVPLSEEDCHIWTKHCAQIKILEEEKATLFKKLGEVELKLEEAQKTQQNYSAARWGATSAKDALIKRLKTEVEAAYDVYSAKGREIDALKNTRKWLGELVESKEKMQAFYEKCMQEKENSWKDLYGEVQPIKDHVYLPLLVEGTVCIRSGEIRSQGSESTVAGNSTCNERSSTYKFPNEHCMDIAIKRLELGGCKGMRRDSWCVLTIFDRV